MAKINLKPIFSAPLVFISVIRKIKFNGFLGGILIGALFSLFVNVITVQIQETINKQRVLEAIEWEIFNNASLSTNIVDEAGIIFKESRIPSPFYVYRSYSRDFWQQSIEPMLYIAQLSPEIQTKLMVYYTVTVPGLNNLVESNKKISENLLQDCYSVYKEISSEEMNNCKKFYYEIVKTNMDTANDMFEESFDILQTFHPTQDRLNNVFLKLMMSGNSVRVLSGK